MNGKKGKWHPELRKKLLELTTVERKKQHPLLHEIHKEHKISKRTLFYIKEYGPNTHVTKTIVKESAKILLLTSVVSSFGGLTLEHVKTAFISIVPLVILLPTLNDMIGDFGTITASRFSTMLHEGKAGGNPMKNRELQKLFVQILVLALFTAVLSASIALFISSFSWKALNAGVAAKIFLMVIVDVMALVCLMFFISVIAGRYFFKRQEDPNNFLIPITTSISDYGNMAILAIMVTFLF